MKNQTEIQKLLEEYKIEATPVRIQVLALMKKSSNTEFTHAQILSLVRINMPAVSPSVVASALRLFKARSLIREFQVLQNGRDRKRGRPQTKFLYSESDNVGKD
jgi:Fe2+ or Zn2+ uptake regulation protein